MRILFLVTLIIPLNAIAQDVFNFNSEQMTLTEIQNRELKLGSISTGFHQFNPYLNENFGVIISNHEVIQKPLIFERTTDNFFPKLSIWYFYDQDSIIRGKNYQWGFYNPSFNPTENLDILKKEKSRFKEYKIKHEQVYENILEILGQPLERKVISKQKTNYFEQTIWDNKDSKTILSFKFDPQITNIPGTEFVAGGHSQILIETWDK